MRTALMAIGLIWAFIGIGNIVVGFYKINEAGYSTGWSTFALIFNMILFVLPGLGVAGLGKLIKKKSVARAADNKKCPRCAETIKAEALVCRFCGHEFAPGFQPPSPPGHSSTRS